MLFNSWQFVVFFPVVTTLFVLSSPRQRLPLLLAASSLFYMAFVPRYILILLLLIAVDYAAGLAIDGSEGRRRKLWLVASVVANVGILAVFKYFDFFSRSATVLAAALGYEWAAPTLGLVLPIGLSFHTFQSLSYTIEVYRGRFVAERSVWRFALYILFYPQLVAGPIERPQTLLPQLSLGRSIGKAELEGGLALILWGLFKKVVVADRLALTVSTTYGDAEHAVGPLIVLGTVCFAFQIYYDFSGYCDIAIGAARVMGIRLSQNFNRPYSAESISEFWMRWHISLSSWFRDYVYRPIVGESDSRARHHLAVWSVFLLSGLWHGAAWQFISWGALHAGYLTFGELTRRWRRRGARVIGLANNPRLYRLSRQATTFCLVSVSWIFFRGLGLSGALALLHRLPAGWSLAMVSDRWVTSQASAPQVPLILEICILAALVGFVEVVMHYESRNRAEVLFRSFPLLVRRGLYVGLAIGILNLGVYTTRPFVYFQF